MGACRLLFPVGSHHLCLPGPDGSWTCGSVSVDPNVSCHRTGQTGNVEKTIIWWEGINVGYTEYPSVRVTWGRGPHGFPRTIR